MNYYLDTIEQIKGEEEGTYTEYGKREKKDSEQAALVAFYDKLKNVANSTQHTFMDIRIVNSIGGCVKKDYIGKYVDVETPAE
jgi:endo-alpha-1,4-polygalactosaminidase (GH114 family)